MAHQTADASIGQPHIIVQIQNGVHHTVFPTDIADAKPQYPTPAWDSR